MSKSASLRRIQADVRELSEEPSDRYHAAPLEDDMFEWHFTIRGADGTDFEGGIYHGRILLPPEYPFKPPHIMFLTPSGRFEVNTKICLSFSAYHPELWQPAWGIRLILEALISFLPAPAGGAIGALDWSKEERQRLAKESRDFCCVKCGKIANLLPKECKKIPNDGSTKSPSESKFAKELQKLHQLQLANNAKQNNKSSSSSSSTPSNAKQTVDQIAVSETGDQENNLENTRTNTSTHSNAKVGNANDTLDPNSAPNQVTSPRHPWITDPLIHGSIITFAAIVFLLFRKVDSLLDELRDLNESDPL